MKIISLRILLNHFRVFLLATAFFLPLDALVFVDPIMLSPKTIKTRTMIPKIILIFMAESFFFLDLFEERESSKFVFLSVFLGVVGGFTSKASPLLLFYAVGAAKFALFWGPGTFCFLRAFIEVSLWLLTLMISNIG